MSGPRLGLSRDQRRDRRTKLTDERAEQILELLRSGVFLSTAAEASGIAPSTLMSWIAAGAKLEDQDRDDYSEDETFLTWFAWECRKALAQAELADWDALGHLGRSGMPHAVKALTWRLERRHPAKYAPKATVIEGDTGALASEPDLASLSDLQLAQLDEILSSIAKDDDDAKRSKD